jgi:hypothetical protein
MSAADATRQSAETSGGMRIMQQCSQSTASFCKLTESPGVHCSAASKQLSKVTARRADGDATPRVA